MSAPFTPRVTSHSPTVTAAPSTSSARSRCDDDPAELAYYLGEAGYLHLAEVFTTDEMAQVSADMDAALPRYHDGDGRSWWATTADGEERAVRLPRFQEESPATAALLEETISSFRLASVTGDGHVPQDQGGNKIEGALVKAHRGRRGHLRPALAHGLQPRAALLALLQPYVWDLGHRRGPTLGPARCRGRFTPGPRPARTSSRDSWGLPAVRSRPAPATSPSTCSCTLPRGPCARRAGTPRHVYRFRLAPSCR